MHDVLPYWQFRRQASVAMGADASCRLGNYDQGMAKITTIGGRLPPRLFIREWMEERGLNQAQLAARMETSGANVSRKLQAMRGMKLEDLAWFASALDLQPEELFHHPAKPSADQLLRQLEPDSRDAVLTLITSRTGTRG